MMFTEKRKKEKIPELNQQTGIGHNGSLRTLILWLAALCVLFAFLS